MNCLKAVAIGGGRAKSTVDNNYIVFGMISCAVSGIAQTTIASRSNAPEGSNPLLQFIQTTSVGPQHLDSHRLLTLAQSSDEAELSLPWRFGRTD